MSDNRLIRIVLDAARRLEEVAEQKKMPEPTRKQIRFEASRMREELIEYLDHNEEG